MSEVRASAALAEGESFTVRPGEPADLHRGLVRLSAAVIRRMGLRAGSVAQCQGTRATYARLVPAPDGALSETEIALSDIVLENAGTAPGERITLTPTALPRLRRLCITVNEGRGRAEAIRNALLDQPVRPGDHLALRLPGVALRRAIVENCEPPEGGLIGVETTVALLGPPPSTPYPGIGGLDEQIAKLREMVELPITRPELFRHLGIEPPRGVLFTGPPGSGKTSLARAVAEESAARFFHINAPEIVSKHYGDSERKLREVFREAERAAPAIIFIDEIDAIAPKRDAVSGEKQLEKRVVAQLLALMDGLSDRGKVVVMAATNLPHMLDPALRRPGRFDREVAFAAPDRAARLQILEVHTANMPLAQEVDLGAVAARTVGFVGADLAAVAREAGMAALRRVSSLQAPEAPVDVADLQITQGDFDTVLGAMGPSVLRETQVETPEVGWTDIGGLAETKAMLAETILWPLHQAALAEGLGLEPVSGVLLQGPPGSGKTLLARAIASESGLNFIPVRASRLLSQYMGEAERLIADLFAQARHAAPCLLFFDEIDALAPNRAAGDTAVARVVAQLLTEIDGIEGRRGVILLGATNRIEAVDPALLRPGRFDLTVEIPLPGSRARAEILAVHARGKPLSSDVDLVALAEAAEGWTGAELAALCQGAARQAMRRCLLAGEMTAPAALERDDFDVAFRERLQSDRLRRRSAP
ncbi:MAG: AAA family ATPase [Pseudomonadota bacterium]